METKYLILGATGSIGFAFTNGLIKPIFGNAAKKKPIEWLINADVPHQFVYTNDAAKLFFMLSKENDLPNYYLINYGGEVVASITEWSKAISQISGGPDKVKVNSKTILNILSWFVPVVKELKENFYQFENTILLDDTKIKNHFPDFQPTKMEDAIAETIDWFRNNSSE